MVLLANVALTDTFDIWRQRTNQMIIEINRLDSENDSNTTNLGGALTTANSNITAAFLKANQVGAAVVTVNTNVTGATSNIANLTGAIDTANASIIPAFLKANQVGEAVTTANSNITAAFLKANQVGEAVTTANGNITSAFNKANNALANTSGVSFNGDLNFPSGNITVNGTANIRSLGVGTDASGVAGEIRATNNITAYYSDERLKTIISTIPNPIDKINSLSGVIYINNETAALYGYNNKNEQIGVIAQEVESVLPQIVKLAPFDSEFVDGVEQSKSGKNYKTVQYEKLIPLLIEAIKELSREIQELKRLK